MNSLLALKSVISSTSLTRMNHFNYKKLVVLAVLLRLLMMPFYFHPDIKTYHFQSSFLKKGVFNIYSYLVDNKQKLPLKEEFVYFPLTYFSLGSYQIVASPLLGSNFTHWLSDASASNSQSPNIFRYLLILKLPYLILDLYIAYLLMKFFSNEDQKKRAFILWLFNPFSIVLIYAFSNVDIFPVTLGVVSLLFLKQKRLVLSALLLGLAAGFKAYPLLFLPFILLFVEKAKGKLLYTLVCLGTFVVIIAPFISVAAFRGSTLISGLTTRIVYPGLSIGYGETLMFSVIVLAVLFFSIVFGKQNKGYEIITSLLCLLLILFSSIHFHIQWLLWALPFWVLAVALNNKFFWSFIIVNSLSFLVPFLYDDKSMSFGLISGISSLYNLLPIPFAIAQKIYDPFITQSTLHSVLVGLSLVVVWQMLNKEKI